MEIIDAHSLTAMLALIGIVILVSALLSGLIERSRFPQVAVFLALGAALGPSGLGSLNLTLDSPAVRIASMLSLTLGDFLKRGYPSQSNPGNVAEKNTTQLWLEGMWCSDKVRRGKGLSKSVFSRLPICD
jgi:hypothetical protein